MKLLFASDSFKGSLTSAQTLQLLTQAAKHVFGACETVGLLFQAVRGEMMMPQILKDAIYRCL